MRSRKFGEERALSKLDEELDCKILLYVRYCNMKHRNNSTEDRFRRSNHESKHGKKEIKGVSNREY